MLYVLAQKAVVKFRLKTLGIGPSVELCVTPLRPCNLSHIEDSSYGGDEFKSRHILFRFEESGPVVEVIYYALLSSSFFSFGGRACKPGWFAAHSDMLKLGLLEKFHKVFHGWSSS